MFDLGKKIALVTGASQGIGRVVARRLAERGARVVLAARSVDKLESLAEEIRGTGGEALPLALDISAPKTVAEQLGGLPEEWREIAILVNNAGITRDGLFARMSLEQWQEVIDTNLTGAYAVTREVVRGIIARGLGLR